MKVGMLKALVLSLSLVSPSVASASGQTVAKLRAAFAPCWNVSSLSAEAAKIAVTLRFDMTPDGMPVKESIRLLKPRDDGTGAVGQAFEVARRAVMVCGAAGLDLPIEEYETWRSVEVVFDPEGT